MEDLIVSILSSAAFTGLLGIVLNESLKNRAALRLDRAKDELQRATLSEVEALKSRLSVLASREHVVFVELQKRRVDALLTVNSALRMMLAEIGGVTGVFHFEGEPSEDEKISTISDALVKFRQVFVQHELLLDDVLAAELKDFERRCFSTADAFAHWKNARARAQESEFAMESMREVVSSTWERYRQQADSFDTEASSQLARIHERMRKLIQTSHVD